MTHVQCNVLDCKHNNDGACTSEWIDISEENCMTVEKEQETK